MSIERTVFGRVDGRPVHRYVMGNRRGTRVAVLTLGANLQSVRTRGRDGCDEITLAYDEVAGYLDPGTPYFGATVGRVANRIAGGAFELDGVGYRLARNAGGVHLHGGEVGFDRRLWEAAAREGDGEARVVLRYRSPAGEEGYPGTLAAQAVYRLTDHDELVIDLQASTDAPTVVNLANHAYWNLAGAAAAPSPSTSCSSTARRCWRRMPTRSPPARSSRSPAPRSTSPPRTPSARASTPPAATTTAS